MASLPGLSRHQNQQPRFEKKVGIVAIGRMGSTSQSASTTRGSHRVILRHKVGTARDVAREFRCIHAKSLAEVNASCEIVISCVSDDAAVESIYGEPGDSLLLGASGLTFIECSTVSPKVHIEVGKRMHDPARRFVEAASRARRCKRMTERCT